MKAINSYNTFIELLAEEIKSGNLPGLKAHRKMMPNGQHRIITRYHSIDNYRPAAVLVALFQEGHQWRFPLIKRTENGDSHSGQIALPGGRMEVGETPEKTALREAHEEIGVNISNVKVIGSLTPLPVPVSGHIVHPIVGLLSSIPKWSLQKKEVADIFMVDLADLKKESLIKNELREKNQKTYKVPYYDFKGKKVWGATAMILCELSELIYLSQ